ncbi:protein-disulfide reductase DsbD [Maribrevibacterium harenarium]|nr:protein-disulfide reductase DsbD [Maribrevibacterium harenarium]
MKLLFAWIGGWLVMLMANNATAAFLPANEAFQLSHSQTRLEWTIAPGYYLYQERIAVLDGDKAQLPLVWETSAESKDDPNFGLVQVFHQRAAAQIDLNKATLAFPATVKVRYQGCADEGLCYPPQTVTLTLTEPSTLEISETVAPSQEQAQTGAVQPSKERLWWTLASFFVLGVGLSLTPCVLPMIPILLSIITGGKTAPTRRQSFLLALAYVLGMSLAYSAAGVLVGLFGAQLNLQAATQSPLILSIFAGLFVFLALPMFGVFNLDLPSGLKNKLSNVGSNSSAPLVGAAVMGAISAIVVSPCVTAPMAGALLYISTTGDALVGGLTLFALSLGMGVPLLLLGAGGSRLLPKAGMWMELVKHTFGFVLLGIAWLLITRLLPAQISVMGWGVLLLVYVVQIWPEDLATTGKRIGRAVALLLGLYGSSLLLSALAGAPSLVTPLGFLTGGGNSQVANQELTASLFHRTADTAVIQQAIEAQRLGGNPLVIDIYADWCTSCQELEHQVFNTPEALAYQGKITFLQLDITANSPEHQAFLQRHNLFGPPSLLFFNGDTQPKDSFQGDIPRDQFLSRLQGMVR